MPNEARDMRMVRYTRGEKARDFKKWRKGAPAESDWQSRGRGFDSLQLHQVKHNEGQELRLLAISYSFRKEI